MIQNLIFEISFLQKNFRAYNFLYSSTRFSGHHQSLLFDFRFFSRESQSRQKLPKKVTHFVKKTSLIIWTSTHLKLKIICYAVATQPKIFLNLLKIFQQTCFCLVPEKNICTPPFLDAQNCILEALWKEMSVYFCISL